MATLNVVIATGGYGHMFFEINNQTGMENGSWGFQPTKVSITDTENYPSRDSVTSFDITDSQAQRVREWASRNNDDFPDFTFYDYNCVDFVYDALKVAGIPTDNSDFWPGNNVDEMEDAKVRWEHRNDPNYKNAWEKIKDTAKKWWDNATNWRPRIDPLTLDLDGDGIETLGINADNNVLFDHDGDGAKHGTGWVSADDAMLVLDRNNNGTIDNGRELFGDNTQLANGRFAADGFEALADIDSNGDGKINANDTQFANLRLWRDLNQDGVSQANELFTLSDYNIVSLNVAKVENTTTLANGNQIADLGTFTKTDPITGTITTGNMADVNLLNDRFNREFATTLNTTSVANLPDMQGSGAVRDLREAATQSTTLQTRLATYTQATTRAQQLAQLDNLLDAWADTSGMAESMAQRVAANDEEWRVVV